MVNIKAYTRKSVVNIKASLFGSFMLNLWLFDKITYIRYVGNLKERLMCENRNGRQITDGGRRKFIIADRRLHQSTFKVDYSTLHRILRQFFKTVAVQVLVAAILVTMNKRQQLRTAAQPHKSWCW